MIIKEFFDHNDICPICKTFLTKEAEVNVMAHKSKPDDFILAGIVYYNFNGKRFIKNIKKSTHTKNNGKIMASAMGKFPKTFTFNTKLMLRINKTKLADIINPWVINTFDVRFFRECVAAEHTYSYTSRYIFEGEVANKVEMDYEMITVNKFRVFNMFEENIPYKTHIVSAPEKSNKQYNPLFNIELHPIPFYKWNIASYETMKNQLEKYIILK